jgi:hypothetical protein
MFIFINYHKSKFRIKAEEHGRVFSLGKIFQDTLAGVVTRPLARKPSNCGYISGMPKKNCYLLLYNQTLYRTSPPPPSVYQSAFHWVK